MFDQFKTKSHQFFVGLLALLTLWMALPGLASLPVIDRDEARYTQATVQMVESGDYLNIRFQDRARNKKPAGIYWLQAAPVAAVSDPGERVLWAHRLPSVLGFLLTVLATYWGGLAFLTRPQAAMAGALMACALLMVFEGHIAKTDAVLCGFCTLGLASLLHLRDNPSKKTAIIFWIAMGAALMIKGPILPTLAILTLGGLAIWERNTAWMRPLLSPIGIGLCFLMTVPWGIAIWIETDGAFFRDAVGGDLAPKLAGGQEKHGAPFGYYTLTLPVFFWPASAFLIAGLLWAFNNAKRSTFHPLGYPIRLLLMWAIPFWIMIEIVPTKLPNYFLPTYPAFALLIAASFSALGTMTLLRRVGAGLLGLLALILAIVVCYALYDYGQLNALVITGAALAVCVALYASHQLWTAQLERGFIATLVGAAIIMPLTYQFILPKLDHIFVAKRMAQSFETQDLTLPRQGGPTILSPTFTEPSLVYYLGTDIKLGDKITDADLKPGAIILLDKNREESKEWRESIGCRTDLFTLSGLNYSKGDEVELSALRLKACEN